MARIVLATVGSAGDINPFIALGIGLRARGHDVVFATEARSGANVAAAGFPVRTLTGDIIAAVGPQITAQLGSGNVLKAMRHIVSDYIAPTMRLRVKELAEACAGAALLISVAVPSMPAAFVADLLSVPLVTLVTTPAGIPSTIISEVTEWRDSGATHRAVFATKTGPMRTRGVHTFLTTATGTRYTWAMEWDETPGPLGAALNLPLLRLYSPALSLRTGTTT